MGSEMCIRDRLMYELAINEMAIEEYHGKFGNSDKLPWAELEISENPAECNLATGYGTKDDTSGIITYTNAFSFQNGYLNENSVIELEFGTLTLSAGDNSCLGLPLEEPIRLSLPLNFMTEKSVSVSPDIEVTIDNYEYHLDDMVITPLSIQWYAKRGSKIGRLAGETAPLTCKFRDGTEIRNYQITGASECNGEREFFTVLWDKPINPYDLYSVIIGGCEILLNGNKISLAD